MTVATAGWPSSQPNASSNSVWPRALANASSASTRANVRSERLLDRHRRIGDVELVQVDVIGAEAPEAVLERACRPARAGATAVRVAGRSHTELGRDDDIVATLAERASEVLLGAPPALGVG